MMEEKRTQKIPIWPVVVRLFHWGIVVIMVAVYITGLGEEAWLYYHVHIGYLCLAIVIWRIFYGFYGPFYLRFKNFVVNPSSMITYMKQLLQRKPPSHIGHPPPAGWMIVAFMVVITIICITGAFLFAGEERHFFGMRLSNDVGAVFRFIHEWGSWLLLAMIFAHVCGVLNDSLLHKVNLTKAMFTGKKPVSQNEYDSYQKENHPAKWSVGGLVFMFILMGVVAASSYQQSEFFTPDPPPLLELAENGQLWKDECGICHQAFHPSLLPERSWDRLVAELEDHFGEDASLEEEDAATILGFLKQHAAEHSTFEPAYKIRNSLKPEDVPIAISDTPYYIRKHKNIPEEIYRRPDIRSKSNCLACHEDADYGTFEDHLITYKGPGSEDDD